MQLVVTITILKIQKEKNDKRKRFKTRNKKTKKAIKLLKNEDGSKNPSYIQLMNFFLLCRLEVELTLMQNLLQNFTPDGEQENT